MNIQETLKPTGLVYIREHDLYDNNEKLFKND